MLERFGEIRDVGFDGADVEDFFLDDVDQKAELLGERKDEGTQSGDVVFEGLAGDDHEIFRERNTEDALGVFFLGDAGVTGGVGTLVGAHGVEQLVLGAAAVGGEVREEDGSAAHAEDAVGDEHGTVVAHVAVQGHVLRAHHHCVRRFVHLRVRSSEKLMQ